MKLTMVGTGYVGLVTGTCFSNTGNEVTCLDIDEEKIATLKRNESPIYEPGLTEMIMRNAGAGRLHFTTDQRAAYAEAEAIFICVGTPTDERGEVDIKTVLQVAGEIASALQRCGAEDRPKLIVVKSTVPVGTTHRVAELIRSRTKTPFVIANNPEFLKEGAAINDCLRPDRVVCGVEEEQAERMLRDIYDPFVRQGNPIIMIDIRSCEMVKYASNAMLATKISFVNEIANLCEYYSADIRAVRRGMCSDRRIGNQFLFPGLGFGGSCFPKDILGIIAMGDAVGYPCKLASAVREVNEHQRHSFWSKISEHFGSNLNGRTLAFWGVAFKPETDDIREAPAITLMQEALRCGASVQAFDPVAMDNLRKVLPEVHAAADIYQAVDGADALIVCTEWSEFRHPDFQRMARALKSPIIFDGRNMYRPEQMAELGFTYYSIGRDPIRHDAQAPVPGSSVPTSSG